MKKGDLKFEKKTKRILYGMEFTHGVRRALMAALALLYFISFGFSVVSVTTLFAISTLIMMFFEFPTGAIADYDSRKKSIMISFFLMAVAFFGLFIFSNFWFLAISWILGDIAWTFSSGVSGAWVIDALSYAKEKSKIINLISRGYSFEKSGYVLGGLAGFFLVLINFRFVWLFVSLSNLFMFFIVWKYMEERNFKPTKSKSNYLVKSLIKAKESFRYILHVDNRELKILLIAGLFSTLAISSFFIGVPLIFTEKLGIGSENVSLIYSILGVLAIGSPFIAEKLANKRGFRQSLFILFISMAIFIILFTISESLILSLIVLGMLNIFLAGSDVIQDSAFHHEFDSKIRASLGSLNSIFWAVAHSTAVFLTGLGIHFIGLVNTLIISGVLGLVTALIYLWGLKKD